MSGPVRRSRRYAIAFLLGADVADVEPYQPTRIRAVYQVAGSVEFYVALRAGERPPADVAGAWAAIGESYGYAVWQGTPAPEQPAGVVDARSDYERMLAGDPPRGK